MEEQGQEQPQEQGGGDPVKDMIVQTDQALTKLAQVIAKASPEAGEALGQLSEQFRQIIQSAMSGGGGARQQPAQQMGPPETGGRPGQQAY